MNLFEISAQYRGAAAALEASEDMPDEVIKDTLDAIKGEFSDKVLAVAAFILNTEAEAKAMKAAEEAIAARRKSREKKAERLREYLLFGMKSLSVPKVESAQFVVRIKTNPPSLVVSDLVALTEARPELVERKVEFAPKANEIKELLKAGTAVEGCSLSSKEKVEIK